MQLFQPFDQKWRLAHLLLVKNQKIINFLAMMVEVLLLLFIPLAYLTNDLTLLDYSLFYQLGVKMGTVSFILYLITHFPGIFKRFQLVPVFNASITLFRRHIGILTFVTAILHLSLVNTLPFLIYGGPLNLTQREIYGLIGVLILFPLWLTSNDYSQQKMGKSWKYLQRLTYLAIFFIYLHVALVEMSLAIVGGIVFSLVIMSWVNQFLANRQPF